MFSYGKTKSDGEVLKMSPFQVTKLTLLTYGFFEYRWRRCIIDAINTELHRQVVDLSHIQMIFAFCAAALVLGLSLAIPFGIISGFLALPFALIIVIAGIVYVCTYSRAVHRVASGIHEIEVANGKLSLIKPWLASVLYLLYPLGILYIQSHINKIKWASCEQSKSTVVLR